MKATPAWCAALALGSGLLVPASPARALPTKTLECVAAYEQGQRLWRGAHLRGARERLRTCARSVCPAAVRSDCAAWLTELDAAIPSIVVGARDTSGKALTARLLFDGEALDPQLDASGVDVDPGTHVVRGEVGERAVEQSIVVHQGEKNRAVTLVFREPERPKAPAGPANPAPESQPSASPPPGAWLFGGIGVAAIGSFAYFGISASADVRSMRQTCAPRCDPADVSAAHAKLVAADISLGVGLVSLAIAAFSWSESAGTTRPEPTLDVHPVPRGAMAELGGRF